MTAVINERRLQHGRGRPPSPSPRPPTPMVLPASRASLAPRATARTVPSTSWPRPGTRISIEQVGQAVGEEALSSGYSGWYAPACDTHRSPFAGRRNFEYFSEDPCSALNLCRRDSGSRLSRLLWLREALRPQRPGVLSHPARHDLGDRADHARMLPAAVRDRRQEALRRHEVHLDDQAPCPPRRCGVHGVMSSFNYMSAPSGRAAARAFSPLLRDEWGFRGAVITDFNLYGTWRRTRPCSRAMICSSHTLP